MNISKKMYTRKNFLLSLLTLITLPGSLFANKSSVELDIPKSAKKGSIIQIKVKVIHKGNSFFHYSNWVYIKINGETLKKWEFTAWKRPGSEVFTRELVYTVAGPTNVSAKAHCNLHGSIGEKSKKIKVY